MIDEDDDEGNHRGPNANEYFNDNEDGEDNDGDGEEEGNTNNNNLEVDFEMVAIHLFIAREFIMTLFALLIIILTFKLNPRMMVPEMVINFHCKGLKQMPTCSSFSFILRRRE